MSTSETVITVKKGLFRTKAIGLMIALGAIAALPVSAAWASTTRADDSTSLYASLAGTSVLGVPVPVLGTQGYTLTLPVNEAVVPQFVWNAIDFTVVSSARVGNLEIYNLDVDPHMAH